MLAIVWGSSFILIKKVIIAFDPFQAACIRLSISGLAFYPVIYHFRHQIEWKKIGYFAIVGLTGSGIPAFMYPLAQTEVSSSIAGILNSLTPIFTFFIGILFYKSTFAIPKFLGIILGLIGATLLALYSDGDQSVTKIWYTGFIVIASICYAYNVNAIKAYFQDTKAVIISAVSFGIVSIPAMIYLFTTDFIEILTVHESAWFSLGAGVILSLFGTVMATVLFFKLVQDTNPVFGASVSYIMPLIALVWGFLDGELMTLFHFLGMGLILMGVYLIRK